MNRYAKLGVGLGALIVGLAFIAESQGSIYVIPAGPLGTYHYVTDLAGWASYDAIKQQDKLWKFVGTDTDFDLSQPITFNLLTPGGIDNHALTVGSPVDGGSGPYTYTMKYSIEVDSSDTANALRFINKASLHVDADDSTGVWYVEKLIKDISGNLLADLRVDNGQTAVVSATFVPNKIVFVEETWYADSNSSLANSTNTFVETIVPEPAAIIVWTLLGAGSWLGMRVWRRRGGPVGRQPWSPESREAIHEIIARGANR
jgi:hypothetical protein